MHVVKRNGSVEKVSFDKITSRIEKLCHSLNMKFVVPAVVTQKVVSGLMKGITTRELDNLSAETCASMSTVHPDYGLLAARIAISNLQKETMPLFSMCFKQLFHEQMVSPFHYQIVQKNANLIDTAIRDKRDFDFNYFGFRTLEKSYLWRINDKIVERPQYMFMRVALGIHGDDLESVIETYNLMSQKYFIHATPTLFSAASPMPQLSSCFLLSINSDSIKGIFDSLKECALISKAAGGIGISVHNIRAKGSNISTTGKSNGLVPMLRVFNNTAAYVDQGGGKRPGAIAVYLEPWHADIFDFLDLKKNTGKEELRARELFYGLWIPDLFMERVKSDGDWSLMCPKKCPDLDKVYGREFEILYVKYESEKRANRVVKAQELWRAIMEAQVETGTPFLLFKDACNRKSNQKYLGTITCSNLCTEIIEYSSPDEIAVCNLASIAVNEFCENGIYNFDKLHDVVCVVTKNLNRVIDCNYYPLEKARLSNLRHRPIGIGVQGLADAFILMRYPYESKEARLLNRQIFETIYYAALKTSCDLNGTHDRFTESPAARGILQFDMWNKTPTDLWDWKSLKEYIVARGLLNSLLVAPMPTASTAQILGNNESIEPYTSNFYTRRVLSGEFHVINQHLLNDLIQLDLWNHEMQNEIIANRGSVQSIERIPREIRELYKTVWEISVKNYIQMAADRGAFIDQSQSFNVHVAEPSYAKLSSIYFYAWQMGLKTGSYYLRTKPAANAIQFTVDKKKIDCFACSS